MKELALLEALYFIWHDKILICAERAQKFLKSRDLALSYEIRIIEQYLYEGWGRSSLKKFYLSNRAVRAQIVFYAYSVKK